MPSLFIGPTGQYINTTGPMSQTHRIDGKLHIFSKKITEEEARKRVAEKRAKEATEKKAKGPTVEAKKSKTAGVGTVEEWLEKLVKIHAIEEDYTDDNKVDEWLSKIQDNGDYNEYQEEAIMAYGGHSDVAEKLYKNLLSKGYTKSSLISAFKDMAQDGYSMFEDLIN